MPEKTYEYHPFANAFPMMSDQEYRELVADIKANGQREPITRYHGKLLDGRNRDKACRELGIKPLYNDFEGDASEAIAFVISMNLMRRHLTTSQRAMIAADLVTLGRGQRKSDTSNDVSQGDAAKMTKTSLPTVQRASKVKQRGTPELVAAVKAGDVTLSEAVAQVDANGAANTVRQGDKRDGDGNHVADLSEDDEDEGDEDVEDIVDDRPHVTNVTESTAPLSYSFKRPDGSVAIYLPEPETIDDAVKILMQVETAETWRTVFPGDDLHRLVDLGDHVRMLVATGSPARSKPTTKKAVKTKKPTAKTKSKRRAKTLQANRT